MLLTRKEASIKIRLNRLTGYIDHRPAVGTTRLVILSLLVGLGQQWLHSGSSSAIADWRLKVALDYGSRGTAPVGSE